MNLSLTEIFHKIGLYLLLCAISIPSAWAYQSAYEGDSAEVIHENLLVYELFNQIYTTVRKPKVKQAPARTLPHFEIFGWHPGWSANTFRDYHYNTLTALSYSEVTITAKDSFLKMNAPNWDTPGTQELIELAEEGNARVLLTIKCIDAQAYELLFSSPSASTTAIDEILSYILQYDHVDGVSIVFERLPEKNTRDFINFIADLGIELKQLDKSLVLSLPAIPRPVHNLIMQLDPVIDRYVLQAYNYQDRSKPSPVSPMFESREWGALSVDNSIQRYLNLGIEKEKLIVTLPYFGVRWARSAQGGYSYAGRHDYSDIAVLLNDTTEVTYDSASMTAVLNATIEDTDYTYYFDDENTLQFKINQLMADGLAGAGVWALGYDNDRPELWQMLRDSLNSATSINQPKTTPTWYSLKPETISKPLTVKPDQLLAQAKTIVTQKEVFVVGGLLLLGFIIVAFLITLTNPVVYEKIFITEWSVYLKFCAFLIAFVIISILVANFAFESAPQVAGPLEPYQEEPILVSGKVVALVIRYGLIGFGIISLLSWKVFLKINTDLP